MEGKSLFDQAAEEARRKAAPLAERMRPRNLEEFVGQSHLLGEGRILRRLIENGELMSLILWGPPGSGKTTLGRLMAERAGAYLKVLSAVTAGVADLRRAVEEARERLGMYGQRTVVFVDEIHRFNKAQQDAILPHVERGEVVLIGATTENPYFEVIGPLLSRCSLFRLEPLSAEEVEIILERALADGERGLFSYRPEVPPEVIRFLADVTGGDARAALNALEMAVLATRPGPEGKRRVTLETAREAVQRRGILYDREGDQHYDHVSAFIKSIRGGDPDAAVYWLARMLEAGEDPRFLARRMLVHAAEDVGLADPQALVIAAAAALAVEWVGLPEARIPLAEAAIYLSSAPKSNSAYLAISRAEREVRERRFAGVPLHLRDSHYPGARRLGHGEGYLYPHDFPGGFVRQRYLPEGLEGGYYRPGKRGYEREIARRLREWWGERFRPREEEG